MDTIPEMCAVKPRGRNWVSHENSENKDRGQIDLPIRRAFAPSPGRRRSLIFDFDSIIERRGTHSSKWDGIELLSGITSPDAIPMWVADMDFAAPPGVTAALTAEVERATHGY